MKKLTVVIPEYNRGDDLVATIESLSACDKSLFDLVVVDQTTNHSQEVLDKLAAFEKDFPMQWLTGVKPNLPGARNVGARACATEFVLYVDNDVLVEPDFITKYCEVINDKPECDAIFGPVYSPKGLEVASEIKSTNPLMKRITPPCTKDHPEGGWVTAGRGCNMAFRVDTLEEVGGFNEGFTGNPLREESELFCRFHGAGKKIWFAPECGLVHLEAAEGGCRPAGGITLSNYLRFYISYYRNNAWFATGATKSIKGYSFFMLEVVRLVAFSGKGCWRGAVRFCVHLGICLIGVLKCVLDRRKFEVC